MNITDEIDDFIVINGHGNIRDALNVALARLKEVEETLKDLEYINIEDFIDVNLKWKYCPSCGYKEPDGHWKDCELWLALEKIKF